MPSIGGQGSYEPAAAADQDCYPASGRECEGQESGSDVNVARRREHDLRNWRGDDFEGGHVDLKFDL